MACWSLLQRKTQTKEQPLEIQQRIRMEDRIDLCTHQLAACLFSNVSSNRHPKFPEMLQEEGEAVSPSFSFVSCLSLKIQLCFFCAVYMWETFSQTSLLEANLKTSLLETYPYPLSRLEFLVWCICFQGVVSKINHPGRGKVLWTPSW